MLTVIVIILLFAGLVLFHEWGHFIAARRNGVDVSEFGIGFPPKVVGKQWGKTLYSFNLLPLGGFVRLAGEDTGDNGPGTFGAAGLWTKTKILLAGVLMNVIAAFVIFYFLCVIGLPGLGAPYEPGFLKSTYSEPKQLLLADVDAGSPAAKAGLVRGDILITANGRALATDDQLLQFTTAQAGKVVHLVINHKGTNRSVDVRLRDPQATNGHLGVVSQQVYKLRYDPLRAVVAAAWITGALFVATIAGIFNLLISLPSLIINVFGHNVPQAAEAASGPVGIVFILKSLSSLGMSYLWLFIANISVALAAFNVLPLPALDGGRWFVLVVQRVTRRTWSATAEARYHAIGFAALIGLMLLITVYDVRKFF